MLQVFSLCRCRIEDDLQAYSTGGVCLTMAENFYYATENVNVDPKPNHLLFSYHLD